MKIAVLGLMLLTASAVSAQTSADPSGHWRGTIDIPNNPLDFEVDFAKNTRGELVGTATAGPDKVTLPLIKISLEGKRLAFYGRTDQPFRAEISDSGKMMSGTATLSGYALPFGLSRTGEAKIDATPVSPAVTKQLEGDWKGLLVAPGAEYHLIVTFANQADGTALARSVSVDEGGLTIPLTVAQNGPTVTFQSRYIPISYAGTLNAAGTELTGTFSQGGVSLPLSLTRLVTK